MSDGIKGYENKLDEFLSELLVDKLPPLRQDFRDFFIQAVPWLALIGGVLTIPAVFSMMGIGALFGQMMFVDNGMWIGYYVSTLLMVVSGILDFMAFQPLRENKFKGWKLLWYGSLIGVLSSILNFEILSVAFSFVGLYILYQIKAHYTGEQPEVPVPPSQEVPTPPKPETPQDIPDPS